MSYKSEDIDKLIDQLKIEDVVGEFVDLKKSGANYKGLCPFHADTNPSFSVNPAKNICKCFVCGAGGNPITFYSKYKKISFNESVKELSKKYKISIKEYKVENDNNKEHEKYFEIMEEAHKFFTENIFSNSARQSLEYLINRGFTTQLIRENQLGYASNRWSELYEYLLEKSYKADDILELGLIKRNEEGKFYDTFRNRIIFPIYSTHGRVIAFGGRTLESDTSIPKYINSPDTPIFKKGRNLYGIDRARVIKEKNYSILMEGYMDVLSACVYGFDTSIAPLGTALTVEQAKLIKRYSSNILLSFDMDKAGINAAERAGFILKSQGFNIRILEFSDAKDPDEFLRKKGRAAFLEIVKNSTEIFDFLYKVYANEYDLKDVMSKHNFIERFKDFFISLENDLEKEIYLKRFSEKIDLDIEVLRKTLITDNHQKKIRKYEGQKEEKVEDKKYIQNYFIEFSVIKLLLKNPEYYSFFKDKNFKIETVKKIFNFFEEKIKENLIIDSKNIIRDFKNYIEKNENFTEYEKENDLAELIVNCAIDFEDEVKEKENLEIFKSFFRIKIADKLKKTKDFEMKFKLGKFSKEIEEVKTIDEFIKKYNLNEVLLKTVD